MSHADLCDSWWELTAAERADQLRLTGKILTVMGTDRETGEPHISQYIHPGPQICDDCLEASLVEAEQYPNEEESE